MAIDATIGCGQGATGIIKVFIINHAIKVLIFNLAATYAQGVINRLEIERKQLA